jgi:hypothetical protein
VVAVRGWPAAAPSRGDGRFAADAAAARVADGCFGTFGGTVFGAVLVACAVERVLVVPPAADVDALATGPAAFAVVLAVAVGLRAPTTADPFVFAVATGAFPLAFLVAFPGAFVPAARDEAGFAVGSGAERSADTASPGRARGGPCTRVS